MISKTGGGFFAAHWDWIVAAAGLLALAAGGVFFAMSLDVDPELAAGEETASIARMKPSGTGVGETDLALYVLALKAVRSPTTVPEIGEKDESFMSSERRVFCKKCRKAISGDIKAVPACPFCGEKQEEEKKVVVDADGDGLPDEWEKRFGIGRGDASDATADDDGDGFTNLEEFLAKTDPSDPKDHPPYIDSLSVTLPLKETRMPFVFTGAMPVGKSWKCEFFDAKQRDDHGRAGRTLRAGIGEEIGASVKKPSGFVLKAYEKKEVSRERKGMKGMKVKVDVSEATVERKSDGKVVKLRITSNKREKTAPVDVQATLKYVRGDVRTFDVVKGDEIDLNGQKFKIQDIKPLGKGATVTLADSLSGKEYVLNALEQDGK